jgi:hypothetical protein
LNEILNNDIIIKKNEYIKATFIPDAANICNSPELINDCLMSLGGETASSPKTIPPKISKFGDFK